MKINPSCHCIGLRKVSNNIKKVCDTVLSKFRLKITQSSTLRNIQKFENTNIFDLSYLRELNRTTGTRNIKKLIKRDLVFYNYENSNKNKVVSLTTVSKINLEKQLLFGKNLNTNTKALGIKRF